MDERQKRLVLILLLCFLVLSSLIQDQHQTESTDKSSQKSNNNNNQYSYNSEEINENVNNTELHKDPIYDTQQPLYMLHLIQNIGFKGEWVNNNPKQNVFDYFDTNNGKLFFFTQSKQTMDLIQMVFIVYDGEYNDNKKELFVMNFQSYDPNFYYENKTFNFTEQMTKITEENNLKIGIDRVCNIDGVIKYNIDQFPLDETFLTTIDQLEINVELTSKDCDLSISGILKRDQSNIKQLAIQYSMLISLLSILHFVAIVHIIKDILENENNGNKYSIISIGIATIWDSYLCMFNFFLAVNNEILFQYFVIPSFTYFVLFSVFETRLIILLWKCRYYPGSVNPEVFRQNLLRFYTKFYISLMVCWFIIYNYLLDQFFFVIINFFLIPQIIHQSIRGQQQISNHKYIIGFMASRSLLLVYFRCFSSTILNLRPQYSVIFYIFCVIILQIGILQLQNYYGAQVLVPSFLLPKKHQYFIKLPFIDEEKGEHAQFFDDCVICMNPLHHQPLSTSTSDVRIPSNPYIDRLRKQKNTLMVAPCDHKFHIQCLLEWMTIKMECPTCRLELPPV